MQLTQHLKNLISQTWPMSMAEFMRLALSHPEYGYYKNSEPFGVHGDFTTAPEISQMFGELIGIWCVDIWHKMDCQDLELVEIGPGRGTLMADLLRITRHIPDFHDSIKISMVETSPRLREIQKQKISSLHKDINWFDKISDVQNRPVIVVCNELFDALPVNQYVKQNGQFHEKMLGVNKAGDLEFMLSPEVASHRNDDALEEGAIIETCPDANIIMAEIASRVKACGGAALIIDYGYTEKPYKSTLSAIKDHKHIPILEDIGKADLSAHVDFPALAEIAKSKGAEVFGATTQGEFLQKLGINLRAEKLMQNATEPQKFSIKSAVDRLIGNGEMQMGELFKVLAIASDGIVPEGF